MPDNKTAVTRFEIRYVPANQLGKLYMKANNSDPSAFLPPNELDVIDMPGMNNTKRPITHPKNLMTIYKMYQVIDGTDDERTAQIKARSMTLGDAIVIKGKAYYVANSDRFPSGFVVKNEAGELVEVTEENCESV